MINYQLLREGDVFFTADNNFLSKAIRFFSKATVSHTGFLIKPYGGKLFYKAEMSLNFSKKESDFSITPLIEDDIIRIRRPNCLYNDEKSRQTLRMGLLKWHENCTLKYDIPELFSGMKLIFGLKASQKDKNKMICSRAVYERLKLDGFQPNQYYEDYVTPQNLLDDPNFLDVTGWKY